MRFFNLVSSNKFLLHSCLGQQKRSVNSSYFMNDHSLIKCGTEEGGNTWNTREDGKDANSFSTVSLVGMRFV